MSVSLLGIMSGFPKSDKVSLDGAAYVVQYKVQATSYDDGPVAVLSCAGLPAFFSPYDINGDSDPDARLREVDTYRESDNSLVWIVWHRYSTPPSKGGDNTGAGQGTHTDTPGSYGDPTLELPVAKTAIVKVEKPITRIFNLNSLAFNPPMNSACQPFVPPPNRDWSHVQLTISRNEPVSLIHPLLGVQYADAVNADFFWGAPPGTWKCQGITAENQRKQVQGVGNIPYMKVEYTFLGRPEGWDVFVLDAGEYYCNGSGSGSGSGNASGYSGYIPSSGKAVPTNCPQCTTKIPFIDQHGHPIKGMLNGQGGRLPDNTLPVWMQLRPYNWLPYSFLSLPNSFAACG